MDYRPGRAHRGLLQFSGERLRKAGVWKDRVNHLNLNLKGKDRLSRTEVVLRATRCARATGMTAGMIHNLDSLAFQLMGGKRGRSKHVRRSLSGELPSCKPVMAPIAAWVEACFDASVPREDQIFAWGASVNTVSGARGPTAAAKGPAGAAIAAALRIGWRMPAWHVLVRRPRSLSPGRQRRAVFVGRPL